MPAQTSSSEVIPVPSAPLAVRGESGILVDHSIVFAIGGDSLSDWMRLFSLPILRLGIDTGFLSGHDYSSWHSGIFDRVSDVEATSIRYRSEAVLGQPETQSGMVFLPAGYRNAGRELTWIVYTKATELKRLEVPSRYAGAESRIGAVIASLGYAVWMPDYPGMGVAPGIHTYCDPGSLARSTLDGLAAARFLLARKATSPADPGSGARPAPIGSVFSVDSGDSGFMGVAESGRFYVMGYSEGGLAAMSVARAIEDGPRWPETGESAPPAGLRLNGVYAMGAPLDLSRGFRGDMAPDTRLGNPVYLLFVLSGYARTHPDSVDPVRIIREDIRKSIIPLLGTDKTAEDINKMIASMRKKPVRDIVASDVLEPDLLLGLIRDHGADPLFRILDEARMDRWNPDPRVPLTLAASRKDRVVPYDNSSEAIRWFSAARRADAAIPVGDSVADSAKTAGMIGDPGLRLLDLASDSHDKAAVEALLFAIMDIDRTETALWVAKTASEHTAMPARTFVGSRTDVGYKPER